MCPPTFRMPQYGTRPVKGVETFLLCWLMNPASFDPVSQVPVAELQKVFGLVLYPSGTDLRTRMPTLSRFDWTLAGNAETGMEGFEGSVSITLRPK